MPLFEFRCDECRHRFQALVGVVAGAEPPACPGCGSARLSKMISRFRVGRSEERRLDELTDTSQLGDPDDPQVVASWMRRAGQEMGEDLGEDVAGLVEEAFAEEAGRERSGEQAETSV